MSQVVNKLGKGSAERKEKDELLIALVQDVDLLRQTVGDLTIQVNELII